MEVKLETRQGDIVYEPAQPEEREKGWFGERVTRVARPEVRGPGYILDVTVNLTEEEKQIYNKHGLARVVVFQKPRTFDMVPPEEPGTTNKRKLEEYGVALMMYQDGLQAHERHPFQDFDMTWFINGGRFQFRSLPDMNEWIEMYKAAIPRMREEFQKYKFTESSMTL